MRFKQLVCFCCLLLGLSGGCCTTPSNLYFHKQALIQYHDSGKYDLQVLRLAKRAMSYIHHRASSGEKNLAIVLDIDDTALSSWDRLRTNDFARKDELFVQWVNAHSDPPILPILELYRESKLLGLKVFFISGRRTFLAQRTETTLQAAGYAQIDGIYLRPDNNKDPSLVAFKSSIRRQISEQGFKIIANIGDQESDLAGGYAERAFKLPNPFYYTP